MRPFSRVVLVTVFPVLASAKEHTLPSSFKLQEALNHYSVESSSLLKRALLSAGFHPDETLEIDDTYLDFATRAMRSEKKRIDRLLDAKKTIQQEMQDRQQCNAETKQCKDPKLSSEFGHFLTPPLKSGQAELLRWDDDHSIVQPYAARVGLPEKLLPTLIDYVDRMGLLDIMKNMLYDDPLPPDGDKWFTFQSPYEEGPVKRNFTWNVERPAKKWKSDMHWFNVADELAHEDSLRALAKGGFDEVLNAIGEQFNLDSLHVDSMGFVAVTNCERGFIHTDWEEVDGRAFNFLIGIQSPAEAGPELVIESDRKGEVYYESNAGVLVGDGTRHGTRECDHRESRGVRITASIYLADLTEDNLKVAAGDTTSIFPPTGDEEWIWAQRGRHWSKDGKRSLVNDLGRKEINVEDDFKDCERRTKNGQCKGNTEERSGCLKTCKVYLHDDEYKPGVSRKEIFGY